VVLGLLLYVWQDFGDARVGYEADILLIGEDVLPLLVVM
jgi:hypothetical protein